MAYSSLARDGCSLELDHRERAARGWVLGWERGIKWVVQDMGRAGVLYNEGGEWDV